MNIIMFNYFIFKKMSNNNNNCNKNSKITIEKRVFKLEDNKEFVLEYPSNYNEIVDRKLKKLNDEYDEVVSKNNKVKNNDDENKENINLDNNNKNENVNNNNNVNDKEYYQPLGELPDNMNNDDDEFIEVKEENINYEIKEKNIEINNNNNNEVNINDFEFIDDNNKKVEYETKEIIDDLKKFNNENKNVDNKNIINNNIKKSRSPLKNPEKIKESMRKLNIKTPEWAKNLSDEDFMNRVKGYLTKKNKK